MQSYIFHLTISEAVWRQYYTGQLKYVVATAHDGRTIRLAARHLRAHARHDGIHGRFRLTTDDRHNFIALERL